MPPLPMGRGCGSARRGMFREGSGLRQNRAQETTRAIRCSDWRWRGAAARRWLAWLRRLRGLRAPIRSPRRRRDRSGYFPGWEKSKCGRSACFQAIRHLRRSPGADSVSLATAVRVWDWVRSVILLFRRPVEQGGVRFRSHLLATNVTYWKARQAVHFGEVVEEKRSNFGGRFVNEATGKLPRED